MLLEGFAYATVFALCWYYMYTQCSKKRRFAKAIGGPSGYPLVGNALDFIKNMNRTLNTIVNWIDQYGGRIAFYFGPVLVLVLNEVEDVETVLTSTKLIQKGEDYDMLKDWLGEGLVTSSGQHWFQRRKLLTHTFHFSILEGYISPINEQANVLLDNLRRHFALKSKEQYLDVSLLLARCTLDIICETAMGIKLNAQTESTASIEFVKAVHRMGALFQYRSIRPWLRNNFMWKLTAGGQEEIQCIKTMHSFADRIIADHKHLLETDNTNKDKRQQLDGGKKTRRSFLELLVNAQQIGNNISDAGIREETTTFTFAGTDTVAVALNFGLFNIGNHPEIQEKLHQEMDAIFQGDNSREITYADLREMKYLECCIKESLRLHPSVPLIARQVTQDFRLDEKTVIPAGVVLYILPFKLHRNPKYFPKPEEFIPERFEFIPGSCMANKNAFAYIPFSAGPRNCIGQKLAMIKMKIILATILRRFRIKSQSRPEELELLSELVLRTKNGLKLSLQER